MFRNYLKISIRSMKRHKGFTAINLVGLAVSLSISLLIVLFIHDQRSYESMHSKRASIYRVLSKIDWNLGGSSWFATSPAAIGKILQENYPMVESAARIYEAETVLQLEGISLQSRAIFTDPAYFDLFDFKLVSGDAKLVLAAPGKVILSLETADRLFGEVDPIGSVVTLEGFGEYVVSGILAKPVGKTHLQFDALVSYASLATIPAQKEIFSQWGKCLFRSYTYFQLKENHSVEELTPHFSDILSSSFAAPQEHFMLTEFRAQALEDINLGESLGNMLGRPTPVILVYLMGGLAIISLLSACFNFISLTIARSLKRAKEVGLRKVMGARRPQLIKQFLFESILTAFLALALAMILLVWLIPAFNQLWFVADLQAFIAFDVFGDLNIYLYFGILTLIIGVVAGLYPALYLSSFLPVRVLKGIERIRGFKGLTFRKVLIVTQFCLSLIFVSSASVVNKQSAHLLKADYGFRTKNLITLHAQGQKYDVLKNIIESEPAVRAVTGSNQLPLAGAVSKTQIQFPRKEPINAIYYSVDDNFIPNMELKLLAGRDFSTELGTNERAKVIVNEAAVSQWELGSVDDAPGILFADKDESMYCEIIGVVRNFNTNILNEVEPIILRYEPEAINYLFVHAEDGKEETVKAAMKESWEKLDKIHPCRFVELGGYTISSVQNMLGDVTRMTGFVGLLITLVASLGLLAITSYNTENRLHEVGVRKLIGASMISLITLLSKDFLKLVLVATLISLPVAWMVNSLWLEEMAQRITLNPGIFLVTILPTIMLALLAVVSQTVRAAMSNPVDVLRDE